MDQHEFEQFVLENGKNILRFCRLTCQDTEMYKATRCPYPSYYGKTKRKNMQTGTGLYQWKAWMPWSMTRFLN